MWQRSRVSRSHKGYERDQNSLQRRWRGCKGKWGQPTDWKTRTSARGWFFICRHFLCQSEFRESWLFREKSWKYTSSFQEPVKIVVLRVPFHFWHVCTYPQFDLFWCYLYIHVADILSIQKTTEIFYNSLNPAVLHILHRPGMPTARSLLAAMVMRTQGLNANLDGLTRRAFGKLV